MVGRSYAASVDVSTIDLAERSIEGTHCMRMAFPWCVIAHAA